MVYEFWKKFNAALSGRNVKIAVVDVVSYLNEAQEVWFTNLVPMAEVTPEITNDLRYFKVDQKSLSLSTIRQGKVLAKYPKDLYKRLNQEVVATCKICPGTTKEFPITVVHSDDINPTKKDSYFRADFQYEQLPAEEGSRGLILHVDGEMNIEQVIISYYRRPKPIHAPSLDKCDDASSGYYYLYNGDKVTKDQNFEVDNTFASNKVVDIAVLTALRDRGEINDFQSQLTKILKIT